MAMMPGAQLGEELIGTIRTFGEDGPMYEVTGHAAPADGEAMFSILVIESGEVLHYEMSAIVADPLKP